MKVFKFGGASVKDVESIKNVAEVLSKTNFTDGFIVISAIGKTTNALEKWVENYLSNQDCKSIKEEIENIHFIICKDLFPENHIVFSELTTQFSTLNNFLTYNKSNDYDFIYDQIVSYGEIFSTLIVSHYLNSIDFKNQWIDARNFIKTNSNYREGIVDWNTTQSKLEELPKSQVFLTQGFIASNKNNFNVTLGREGSDYTAAIIAYCLNAKSMTIWKDVEGVLNADPRYFKDAKLLNKISYSEAVEMAYYGASVIHPKTLKPLENKNIPFCVKSFENPLNNGTLITKGSPIEPQMPCYILKHNQILIVLKPLDFSFISEHHLSKIFDILATFKLKTNLMQTSAISFSICVEDKYNKLESFLSEIEKLCNTEVLKNVSLYTVRYFNNESKKSISENKNVILEQIIKETLQIVVQNK